MTLLTVLTRFRTNNLKGLGATLTVEPFNGRMQQLGIGRKGDGLGLHRGVHRDALEIARADRPGIVTDPPSSSQRAEAPVSANFSAPFAFECSDA